MPGSIATRCTPVRQGCRSAPNLPQNPCRLMRTLRRGLLQPKPCLRRLGVIRFTAQAAELQLRLAIACPGRLAQQLESDATVALAVALAAQQAAKAALRFDHTLARRLLEEASGNPLDALVPAQVLAVQQPQRHAQGQARRWSRGGK